MPQMGFEALMLGKPVFCFGMPFYAGWGITQDDIICPRRTRRRSMLEVFAAAYLIYVGSNDTSCNESTVCMPRFLAEVRPDSTGCALL